MGLRVRLHRKIQLSCAVAQYLIIPKRFARAFPALEKSVQWLEYAAFRLIFAIMRRMPLEAASRLAGFTFGLLGPLSDKRGKVETNLRIAFPDKTEEEIHRISKATFRHLGQAATELIKMPTILSELDERVELVADPTSGAHLQSGAPGVYITAHVGPWQITPLVVNHRYMKQPMAMVYAPESNPFIHKLMYNLRSQIGTELIPSDAGVRPLLKALQNQQSLGLAVDTRLQTGKLIPFFGTEALTNIAPAKIALKAGVPLVTVRGERLAPGQFRLTIEPPIAVPEGDLSQEERAIEMTRQVNERFEHWISDAPEQWMCLKRRWPKAHRL